jgi:hypothetical protein
MKKLLPFVFPLIALLLVMFLAVRWYNARTSHKEGQVSQTEFAEGEKIENLSTDQMNKLKKPVKDLNTVDLKGTENAMGQVRYDISDGRVYFSVVANLPELKEGFYQVWLKEMNGEAKKKAFVLVDSKGGFTGDASISATNLPFEVVVTRETKDDNDIETVVLQGTIQKDSAK